MSHVTSQPIRTSELPCVQHLLHDELQAVEQMLAEQVAGRIPVIDEMVRQGCLNGGKRFRPILLLLAGQAVGQVTERHITLATAIEMIHAATLVHDDILDAAHQRRHQPTINSRWDNHAAVLFGDFLFTHAFYLASTTGDATACQTIEQATKRVCEGELQQSGVAGNYQTPISEYFEIIGKKTASLCGCATRLGAQFSGARDLDAESWESMGTNLGLAFQIVDDILDVQGDAAACGKTLGTDLSTAKPTLPVLMALDQLSAADRQQWTDRLLQPDIDRQAIRQWLTDTGALDAAWQQARQRVMAASRVSARYDNEFARAFEELGQFLFGLSVR